MSLKKLIGRDVSVARIGHAATWVDLISNSDGEADWMSLTFDFGANEIDVSGVSNTWKNFRDGQIGGTITLRARKAAASLLLEQFKDSIDAGDSVAFQFTEDAAGKSIAGSGYYTMDRNDWGGIDTMQAEEVTIRIDGTPTIT